MNFRFIRGTLTILASTAKEVAASFAATWCWLMATSAIASARGVAAFCEDKRQSSAEEGQDSKIFHVGK